jgi:hypothetical protein
LDASAKGWVAKDFGPLRDVLSSTSCRGAGERIRRAGKTVVVIAGVIVDTGGVHAKIELLRACRDSEITYISLLPQLTHVMTSTWCTRSRSARRCRSASAAWRASRPRSLWAWIWVDGGGRGACRRVVWTEEGGELRFSELAASMESFSVSRLLDSE